MLQITSVAPTLCRLMQVPLPELSTPEVIYEVVNAAEGILRGSLVEKCFIYAPDAIGEALFRDYSAEFEPVLRLAPVQIVLNAVLPPKTPVCFASMFTGAQPRDHGIKQYEKPVLRCDTLFDVLLRAKKQVAIAAVVGSSISLIFKERSLSYLIEEYDQQVNNHVLQILHSSNDYDLILVYNQEYDDTMHKTTPRSNEAVRAMQNHVKSFEQLSTAFLKRYKDHTRLVIFSPDHGAHLNPETGRGEHGLDIDEDLEVRSFWGFYAKST